MKDLAALLQRVIRQASRDRITTSAASVAFHWFIALVPGAIALVGITNLVGLKPATLQSLTHGISVLLPSSSAKVFDQALNSPGSSKSSVLAVLIGGFISLWASIEAAAAVQVALDMAYETNGDRGFLKRRVRALVLVGITVVFGGGAFVLLIVGSSVETLIEPARSNGWFSILWTAIRWPVGIAFVVVLISLYDYLGPNRTDNRWRILSVGGAVSTALWLLLAACYSFYLNHVGRTSQTYGTFSGVVALLLWLFLTATVILFGAELNRELERSGAGQRRKHGPRSH